MFIRAYLSVVFFIGILFCASDAAAQSRIPLWFGGGIGYMLGMHSTDGNLRCLNDPSCPQYKDGTGKGLMVGASLDWRLSSGFGLLSRLHLTLPNAEMSAENSSGIVKNANGDIVPLVRSHTLEAQLTSLRFDIAGNVILGKFRIFGGMSPELLLSPTWTSSSTIIAPGNVTFGNKRRDTTFLNDVPIQNASSFLMGATVGIGYDIPLGQKTILTPELTGTLPLMAISNDGNWKQTALALTAHIRFGSGIIKSNEMRIREQFDTVKIRDNSFVGTRFVPGNKIITRDFEETETARITTETNIRRDTIFIGNEPPKGPLVRTDIVAVGGGNAGKKIQEISIGGRFVTEAFPVIPTLFFDAQSDQLPERYRRITSPQDFSVDNLIPNSLIQHKDVLNIIGKRLLDNPRAKITLRGTSDPTTEKSDCDLAEKRAESVKNYLIQVWGIEEKRIKNRTPRRRCEPENPTTSQVEEGYADNRRVEIESEDDEILEPLLRTKFMEVVTVEPQEIEVVIADENANTINQWSVKGRFEKTPLFSQNGSSKPSPIRHRFTDDHIRIMNGAKDGFIEIDAMITDKENRSDEQNSIITIKKDTTEFTVERLSLMTFDVLKDNLNRSAKKAIKRFIDELDTESTISVSGYTDKLGDAELNARLAESRANAVADYIKDIKRNANIVNNVGYGSTKMPPGVNTTSLPEARFLSRTVQIEIIKRIK
jgi:outer membrane protein OmpA-like peptidoglycan-associated protein